MVSDRGGRRPGVVRRRFDTEAADPNVSVIEVVADLEGTEPGSLPPLYTQIDHLLEHLFSDPPVADADAKIAFTYNGYRITVRQDGRALFEPTD